MASFMNDIWSSVFTGGTNRSLILATYASFAALQITLLALLIATRSWHFVFLSVVCACLWGTIVWFIHELEAVRRENAEKGENLDGSGAVGQGEKVETKKEL